MNLLEMLVMIISYFICMCGLYIIINIFSNLNNINTEEYLTWKYKHNCVQDSTLYFSGTHYKGNK